MLVHATSLLVAQRLAGEALALTGNRRLTILPPPCPMWVQPMDFGHAEELMARAEADARAFLADRDGRVVALPRARRRPPHSRATLPSAS
jgi:NTE family protein